MWYKYLGLTKTEFEYYPEILAESESDKKIELTAKGWELYLEKCNVSNQKWPSWTWFDFLVFYENIYMYPETGMKFGLPNGAEVDRAGKILLYKKIIFGMDIEKSTQKPTTLHLKHAKLFSKCGILHVILSGINAGLILILGARAIWLILIAFAIALNS